MSSRSVERGRAFVGTSGWQYRDWRGRFYPDGLSTARWLEHYAGHFRTVEVNNSFYRLPRRETVERWAATVPQGFLLTMKASRYLTHIRRLRDPENPLARMLEVFEGAGSKLGPVLFQLPPNLEADVPRLETLVQAIPARIRAAFEFRHPSWSTQEVFEVLDRSGLALVHADRPGTRVEPIPTAGGWAYLRFHQGGRKRPGYERRKLKAYADRVAECGNTQVFAYFNNDTDGAAVRDAQTFMELLEDRHVAVAA
ncbi:MAG TPA: DUF72 domain-containing protein [Actinomycetota bacterium]|nr:DUF72 domain-containing protein [Actinomycetota bacterium]